MKTLIKTSILLFGFVFLNSCDKKEENKTFTYTYTVNNCSTNEKSFSSVEAMCDDLRNDAANNYCAQELRYQRFQSDCPGRVW